LSRYFIDRNAKYLVLVCASTSFIILAAIAIFILKEAVPAFQHVGFTDLIFGTTWRPTMGGFGILPMIVGSLAVTLGAMILAIPLGLGCAVLLAEVAPHRVRQFLRPAVEILVGIPSVVYGLVAPATAWQPAPLCLRRWFFPPSSASVRTASEPCPGDTRRAL
jgi:phosphate transport system permease protein